MRNKRLQSQVTAGRWTLPAVIFICALCWAVSYTHLDVYKRQVMNSRVMLYIGEETITFVQADLCGVQFVSQQAVSYTHLDVYKRQQFVFPYLL